MTWRRSPKDVPSSRVTHTRWYWPSSTRTKTTSARRDTAQDRPPTPPAASEISRLSHARPDSSKIAQASRTEQGGETGRGDHQPRRWGRAAAAGVADVRQQACRRFGTRAGCAQRSDEV